MKVAKTLAASTAASAKTDAPLFQFSAVALDRAGGGRKVELEKAKVGNYECNSPKVESIVCMCE